MNDNFDLNDFNVYDDEDELSTVYIGIPRGAFMVAPAGREETCKFNLIYIDIKKRWYVAGKELGYDKRISKLQRATLYPIIGPDGVVSLLPVTEPYRGSSRSWIEGWHKIINVARKRWVYVVANKEAKRHEYELAGGLSMPVWPTIEYSDLIKRAIKQSTITTFEELRALEGCGKFGSYYPIEEE